MGGAAIELAHELLPVFSNALKAVDAQMTSTFLGSYGAASQKAIKVFHTSPNGAGLKRAKPQASLEKLCKRSADGKVQGRLGIMSASQAYPLNFGRQVARLISQQLIADGLIA